MPKVYRPEMGKSNRGTAGPGVRQPAIARCAMASKPGDSLCWLEDYVSAINYCSIL